MSKRCCFVTCSIVISLMELIHCCDHATGGVISGVPGIFGPGVSQGTSVGQTVDINNDNVGFGNPNIITLAGLEIVGLDPIDLSIPVANSPGVAGTTEYFIRLGSAVNKTDVAWAGFIIELGSGIGSEFSRLSNREISGVTGLDFDTPDKDPGVTSSSFANIIHEADIITFSEGLVGIDEVASGQNFSIDVPDTVAFGSSIYNFSIRLQPLPVMEAEGDMDGDRDVDGADFLAWQRDPSQGSLDTWRTSFAVFDGDFDQDGDVDGTDFLAWQRDPDLGSLPSWQADFGNTRQTQASALIVVPEPNCVALLALSVLMRLGPRQDKT